jgi:hypothetical protein
MSTASTYTGNKGRLQLWAHRSGPADVPEHHEPVQDAGDVLAAGGGDEALAELLP